MVSMKLSILALIRGHLGTHVYWTGLDGVLDRTRWKVSMKVSILALIRGHLGAHVHTLRCKVARVRHMACHMGHMTIYGYNTWSYDHIWV